MKTYEELFKKFEKMEQSLKHNLSYLSTLKAIVQNDYPEIEKSIIEDFKQKFVSYLNKSKKDEKNMRLLASEIVQFANTKIKK